MGAGQKVKGASRSPRGWGNELIRTLQRCRPASGQLQLVLGGLSPPALGSEGQQDGPGPACLLPCSPTTTPGAARPMPLCGQMANTFILFFGDWGQLRDGDFQAASGG